MKIARYERDGKTEYGFVRGRRVVSSADTELGLPADVQELVSSELLMKASFRRQVERAIKVSPRSVAISEVRLLTPLPRPGKIICLGKNYLEHVEESGGRPPKGLVIFMKPATALAGPFDDILYPPVTTQLDYEGELAVVIGKKCKSVSPRDALGCVLGYTIMNDVSARDLQFGDGQWTRGKSCDTFAPVGPWITTADEVRDPHELAIKTWVNGELRQNSSTRKMIKKVDEIISVLSAGMTLEAGDVVATGTPSGVGFYWKPKPKLLKDGDRVVVKVGKLGRLENRVRLAQSP